jgi:hypothetical protein
MPDETTTYTVVMTGILDRGIAEAIAEKLREGAPDSITVEVREVEPKDGDDD